MEQQKPKSKGGSWIWCRKQGKLVPKEEYYSQVDAPMVMKPMEPFVSPVTKELITDRSQLRQHNKDHGITNSADYSPEYLSKRADVRNQTMLGTTKAAREERRRLISNELTKAGIH